MLAVISYIERMTQMIELALFAGLAAVVLYQLYSVLGRRYGDAPPAPTAQAQSVPIQLSERRKAPAGEALNGIGVAAVKAADSRFEVPKFLNGARKAYEMIVVAHACGDLEALKPLLNADVFAAFEADIAARRDAGALDPIEFISSPRGEIVDARVDNGIVRIGVQLSADIRATTNPDSDAERTDELWTFERAINVSSPNWFLSQVSEPEQAIV